LLPAGGILVQTEEELNGNFDLKLFFKSENHILVKYFGEKL